MSSLYFSAVHKTVSAFELQLPELQSPWITACAASLSAPPFMAMPGNSQLFLNIWAMLLR